MRANITFIRDRFEYFNRIYFEGKLPNVGLRISSSVRTLGTLRHPRNHTSSIKPSDLTLSISSRLDLDRTIIEDTILHEMIHLYIFWFKINDTSSHGVQFKRIMSAINRKYHRNITIIHKGSEEEHYTDRIRKPRIVIITGTKSGEKFVTVCTPSYALKIYRAFDSHSNIQVEKVIASYDPIFAHYPASRTPKIYLIEKEKLDKALHTAVLLEYRGNRFTPKT